MTEDEVLAMIREYPFPNLKVVCDKHGIERTKAGLVECARPECQEGLERRKAEVRAAGAHSLEITEEDKARWRAGLTGRAEPKK